VVTHYHLSTRPPFLNLSDLDPATLADVFTTLDGERAQGLSARVFGRRYMDLRRRTEALLHASFIAAGGAPQRTAPHYFVLGSSPWYEGLAEKMTAVVLPLSALPSAVTSVTYPDSFTAMGLGPDYGLPYEHRPYHGRVYRLEQLAELIAAYGRPGDDHPGAGGYRDYQHRPFEQYIEVQVWSDEPLGELAPGTEPST
jgi:hypothetical protein